MNTQEKKESRLVELWNRRATLNEQEWCELYVLVKSALSRKSLTMMSMIKKLRVDPEDCIQDFFEEKVFALNQHKHKIDHAGVVDFYYKRYLISRLRSLDIQLTVPLVMENRVASENDDENRYSISDEVVPPESTDDLKSDLHTDANMSADLDPDLNIDDLESACLSVDELVAPENDYDDMDSSGGRLRVDGLSPDECRSIDDIRNIFQGRLDIDIDAIQKSAIDFLCAKGEWLHLANHREWVQLYLGCHFCPDGETQEAIPLYKLAKEHKIPSYHMRAVKLGITGPKKIGADAALESFRLSYLGQWLASLGIPVDPEHQLEMSLALKILCLEALKLQRPC